LDLIEPFQGDVFERTVVFLVVSAALKHIVEFKEPNDFYKTYSDKMMDYVSNGNDLNYLNRQNLTLYIRGLCHELNRNGFYHESWINNKVLRSEYEVDDRYPEQTFLGQITENRKGYEFLKNKNLIQADICHFCGDVLSRARYTFTEPVNGITFPVCKSCYEKGRT
jgi:hypothetical protein